MLACYTFEGFVYSVVQYCKEVGINLVNSENGLLANNRVNESKLKFEVMNLVYNFNHRRRLYSL